MGFSSVINSLFLATLLIGGLTQAGCFTFTYPTFRDTDQGDFIQRGSYIALGAIQITDDLNGGLENLAGWFLYQRPFRLWKSKGKNASFNTTFVLNIEDQSTPGGEGLAFILAGDKVLPPNSSGQWLGIVNVQTNGSAKPGIVAIEFDTRKSFPQDLDDNHVGIDINSIYSTEQVSLSSRGINISAGINISVNVQYDGQNLSVFVGDDMKNPVILQTIDLSEYLPKEIFVGFSASTSNYTELNCVRSWDFSGSEMVDDDKLIWVWIVVPLGLVLLFGFVLFLYLKRKFNKVDLEDPHPSIEKAIQGSSTAPQKFRFKELSKATGRFNPKNKLGKGGFGTVYKGILGNKEVAVKRVSKKSTQGKQEFMAEVTTIGNLHHRNLVKLIGWCYESREFLLVYEYMPNGSLDKYIFQVANSGKQETTLSWEKRLSIITGVAQALDYLHNGCEKRVLHRDIKPSNIMLDLEFNARLGDFGLARTIVPSKQTHHSTREVAGTPGYMAPECFLTGRATVETDVYAFGILVLEVFCGRRPRGQTEENEYNSNIVNWLWELYQKEKIVDGVDPRLNCEFNKENMECALILGLSCCHPNPNKRPSMKTVLQVLSGEAPPPELPAERPAFIWPPWPPSFKNVNSSLVGGQLDPFTELSGR